MKRKEAVATAHMEAGARVRPPCVGATSLWAKDHPASQESKERHARKALSKP